MQTKIPIKARHFKQYKDIFQLLFRLWKGTHEKSEAASADNGNGNGQGGSDLESDDLLVLTEEGNDFQLTVDKEELLKDVEKLGPTYIRLAQHMALRNNMLPMPYLDALSKLAERSTAISYDDVRLAVENEIGVNISEVFACFDETPLALSPFDQVHRAVTTERVEVVVKVQKPGVREQVLDDLEAMDEVARLYDKYSGPDEELEIHEILQVFRKAMLADLDYRQEAHNLKALRSYMKELDLIIVPAPIERLSSSRILTVHFIAGNALNESAMTGLLRTERNKLAEQVFYAYLQQFLIDGFVHVDPSPEKLLLTKEGKIALVNLDVVDRIAPNMQAKLIQLLLSITEGSADQTANLLVKLSTRRKNFDEDRFRRAVTELVLIHRDLAVEKLQVGGIFRNIAQASTICGAALPFEISELGATLIKLEEVARYLNPKFDSHAFIHKVVSQIMKRHMFDALSPAHVFHTVVEGFEFIERLPNQISQILESVANNELKVTVHTIDEKVLISGFQKIANRITVGLILASLIIGAAMLMRVQTSFTILGYPGLAMLCFIAAAGCGFVLVLEVLLGDRKTNKQ